MNESSYETIKEFLNSYWEKCDISAVSPPAQAFLCEVLICLEKLMDDVQKMKEDSHHHGGGTGTRSTFYDPSVN